MFERWQETRALRILHSTSSCDEKNMPLSTPGDPSPVLAYLQAGFQLEEGFEKRVVHA